MFFLAPPSRHRPSMRLLCRLTISHTRPTHLLILKTKPPLIASHQLQRSLRSQRKAISYAPPLQRMGSTTPAITIRNATPADAPAIVAIGTAVFTETFRASGCTPEQLQAYLDEAYTHEAILATLTSPTTHTTLVAADPTDKILGFALLNRASSEPIIEQGGYPGPLVELQRLYVGSEAHGRGVGTALMREAERMAREEMGCVTMWLGVWEKNGPAQGLYIGKLGFERVGEHVFDVGGDLQTDWILVKRL